MKNKIKFPIEMFPKEMVDEAKRVSLKTGKPIEDVLMSMMISLGKVLGIDMDYDNYIKNKKNGKI